MVSPVVRQQIRRRCNGKAFVYGVLVAAVATGILLLRSHQTNDTFLDGKLLLYNTPAAAADVAAAKNKKKPGHRVAGLVCDSLGGPFSLEATNEMVYWSDIPRDATFQSPFRNTGSNPLQPTSESLPPQQATVAKEEELFFTFEPDEGGWNNIRMAMETAVALAVSMGRTLVLPPKMRLYLLWNGESDDSNVIGFSDLFHVESIQAEHAAAGLKVITFQQFLEQQAMVGHILHPDNSGRPAFPPDNRTDWNGVRQGASHGEGKALWEWVRSVTTPLPWAFEHCVVALAARPGKRAADSMDAYLEQVRLRDKSQHQQKGMSAWRLRVDSYKGHPTPVNASASGRLAELLAHRNRLCVYDEKLQQAKVVHVVGETKTGFRLLIHFYAFLFFEDWKQDLWIKRFIRDHFRYLDEIQCAAARVIEQVRIRAQEYGDVNGRYDSFHIRRGDFQYNDIWLTAQEIYDDNTHRYVPDGRTVFVASDETNKTFFDPFRSHYNLLFLDDFKDQIRNVNPNYYGMLDQLIASRGTVFVGAFYSTFTGYINRLRGYHAQKDKLPGYEEGQIESYYYVPKSLESYREVMRSYVSVQQAFWQQEFPVSWRDLNHDVTL